MLEKFCVGLVRILLGGILFFLTLLSAVVTCRVYGGSEIVQYGRDSLFLHLFFGAGVIGLTVFYRRRKERKCRKNQWLLLAAAAYLFWILLVPSWGGSDSHQCMASAQGLLQGDFSAWEPVAYSYGTAEGPLGYAYTYPSQNGLILYMAVLAFFWRCGVCSFPDFKYRIFYSGNRELQRMTVWGNERCSLLLWMACCLPFSFYILFVYGTMPGFGLSCLAMERLVRYVEEGRGRDFWIGAAAVAAAVILKSNYEIVLVALFLYLASSGVFRRKARLLVAAVLLITVYVIGNRGIQTGISSVTGRTVSDGAPMIAWVQMGLEESKRGPGWYNGYQVKLFQKADGDADLAAAWAQADLRRTISDMAEEPAKAADFFVRKIESIWAEPTFQSLWIQEVGNTSWAEGSPPWELFKEEGGLNRLYVFAANLVQTFVYAMACVWVIAGMSAKGSRSKHVLMNRTWEKRIEAEKAEKTVKAVKKQGMETVWERQERGETDRWGMLLPGIVFIGGFLFHLVWEAKGQYSVVYFMLLLPYAYLGMERVADVFLDVTGAGKE
ncbi:hypothetical protein DW970_03865 [Clostridium sp. AM48-13]|uniref:hypothetical protein n=1 Tax=Clostridium sp. AM48-13 TaxID=2293034 RepID=UPI000E52E7B7|nr:hypothetical protein DW970_03865 [Clostridium sp. AM48-13]